jgi:hypothetical protein
MMMTELPHILHKKDKEEYISTQFSGKEVYEGYNIVNIGGRKERRELLLGTKKCVSSHMHAFD